MKFQTPVSPFSAYTNGHEPLSCWTSFTTDFDLWSNRFCGTPFVHVARTTSAFVRAPRPKCVGRSPAVRATYRFPAFTSMRLPTPRLFTLPEPVCSPSRTTSSHPFAFPPPLMSTLVFPPAETRRSRSPSLSTSTASRASTPARSEENEEGDFLDGEEKTGQSVNLPAPSFRHARRSPFAVAAITSGKPSLSEIAPENPPP